MEGDLVARYHSPIARLKLWRNWDGPFTVKHIFSEHTLILLNDSGKLFKSSVARVKAYRTSAKNNRSVRAEPPVPLVVTKQLSRGDRRNEPDCRATRRLNAWC